MKPTGIDFGHDGGDPWFSLAVCEVVRSSIYTEMCAPRHETLVA